MADPAELPDLLRALGRFLDRQSATKVEIVNQGAFFAVSWERQNKSGEFSRQPAATSTSEQRAYQDHDMEVLREQARELRKGGGTGSPGGKLDELLRTLGQELARDNIELSTVVQERDGLRVSGIAGGRYFRRLYGTTELLSESRKRRMERGRAQAEKPPGASRSF